MNPKTNNEKTPSGESVSIESVSTRNAVVKQTADIDGFIEKRQEFIQKVSAICVEGKDYHIIKEKKSLAKGGAEKIASIFQWNATFEKDSESLEMLGATPGLVAFKCVLSKGNKFVGEGRGAAMLKNNAGDPNKTLKMAQKSAFIDGVLRASGLSDFFTQDLEDMNQNDIGSHNQVQPYSPSEKQVQLIKDLMEQKRLTEENLLDEGFDLRKLTGGKEGTASELISFLMSYVPKQQVIVQPNGFTETANEMIAKLEQAKDPAELVDIKKQLSQMRQEGYFTTEDLKELAKVYQKAEREIMPPLETPLTEQKKAEQALSPAEKMKALGKKKEEVK